MLRQSLFTVVAAVFLLLLVSSASATSLDPFEDPLQNSNPRAGNNGPSSQIFSPVHSLRRELQYDDDDATEDERNAVQKVLEFSLLILAIGAMLFVILSISVMYKRIGFFPGEYEGAERWDALDDQTLYSVKTEQMPFHQQASNDNISASQYSHVGDAVGISNPNPLTQRQN
ncbi:hypothetical protein TrST_g11099 [Triparma strigata]|uniref:Uncharacterized protein n=1 Tax=Triparma strigata TaxID=1606541 RepID=A0A9W7AHG0_9STRA|nr:hypothetical protein TrST_g11099 [Triparma strigata]